MNKLNTNYTVRLKVLSPVFIGADKNKNWTRGVDFVHHRGEIFILDKDKLFLAFDDDTRERYLSLMGRARFFDLERLITEAVDPDDYAKVVYGYDGRLTSNEIQALIRNGKGEPYIPGSSIKGALASAVFHYLARDNPPNPTDKQAVTGVLGEFSNSLFRFIRPGDAACNGTELCDIELFNLYRRGADWMSDFKKQFSITIENFAPEGEGAFRLSIADGLGEFIATYKDKKGKSCLPTHYRRVIRDEPAPTLFRIVNDYTRTHIRREIEFFENYDEAEDTGLIIEQLERLAGKIEEGGRSCILRMAAGSGFYGITGDWRHPGHLATLHRPDELNRVYSPRSKQREPAHYKSRKVIRANAEVMGFVELRLG